MGSFLSTLLGSNYPPDIFIDFENAQPTSGEEKLFAEADALLQDGEDLIQEIKDYKGCGNLIRMAMNDKTQAAEAKCFDALLVSVKRINNFFLFSKRLEDIFPRLLTTICTVDADGKEAIAEKQALVKQVGAIFNFVLRFDQLRMMTPDLSNDFSYYRRQLGKFRWHQDIIVDSDTASSMGMFTAEHIPMMSTLSKSGTRAVSANQHVVMALAVLANSCRSMVVNRRFSNAETNLFCARSMTGAIVLYDHISDLGVFHKKSPVQLKNCVLLLKDQFRQEGGLINAIHYSTRNFRTAPASIEALFR